MRLLRLVVLVVAGSRRLNAEVVEQFLGLPRILAGDAVGTFQHPQRSQCDVFQIADRGSDQIETGS